VLPGHWTAGLPLQVRTQASPWQTQASGFGANWLRRPPSPPVVGELQATAHLLGDPAQSTWHGLPVQVVSQPPDRQSNEQSQP
jgi:hypothetical protein